MNKHPAPPSGQQPEHRQEYRLSAQETVFIEIEENRIAVTHSVDVSANGLRLHLDQALIPGSILPLCVQLAGNPHRLHLAAEVVWSKPNDTGSDYLAGLSIYESDGTDVQHWKAMIAKRCGS